MEGIHKHHCIVCTVSGFKGVAIDDSVTIPENFSDLVCSPKYLEGKNYFRASAMLAGDDLLGNCTMEVLPNGEVGYPIYVRLDSDYGKLVLMGYLTRKGLSGNTVSHW